MDYYKVEESLQAILSQYLPLTRAQTERIGQISLGVYLAGNTQLRKIARWVKKPSQQDSRVRWLQRTLSQPYLRQEYSYHALVKHVLAGYQCQTLNLVMDRTHLWQSKTDLLSLNLNFRKRAVPLAWMCLPHGRTASQVQITLLRQSLPLLPPAKHIIFHGDGEFGSVALLAYLHELQWDYIVGQAKSTRYRQPPWGSWQPLGSLPVSKARAVYLQAIELTREHAFGPINLFAFYRPHYSNHKRKREIAYCATSLPITPSLRLRGRRRWGIEPFYRDYKSSGWELENSYLSHPQRREGLLTILSLNYLWATCLGRWLCKIGQRTFIDNYPQRHLSLFRIGWDWIVNSYNQGFNCPDLLTLYQ